MSDFIVVGHCTELGVLLYGQFLWPIKDVPHALFECMKCEKSCNKDAILIEYIWSFCTLKPSLLPAQHKGAKSRDHAIVRAQKKVSKGRLNTPPKSCTVVTDPQV